MRASMEQRHPATILVLAVVLVMAGCGGGRSGDAARTSRTGTTSQPPTSRAAPAAPYSSLSFRRDKSRTAVGVDADRSVCALLRAGEVAREVASVIGRTRALRATENDSFELSICRYAGGATVVRVILDGAADATRRYFNMAAEADQIPKLQRGDADFRLVWNVGDDDTYGGAGAYWQPSRHRLVAIRFDRIARVTIAATGSSDRRRRALASRLARRVLARANR
jgi:hypothetical protein